MIDLHTHSTFSDGTVSPTDLIALARKAGLSAVALCDHNTVAGLPDFMSAAEHSGVEAVPGIEFSTDYNDTELHILGLFIDPAHYTPIQRKLNEALQRKEESNRALIRALNRAGIDLDYDGLKAKTAGGFVNRAVIGAEMTRKGYTASVKDAFDRWLNPCHGHYVPPRRLDAFEMIRFIRYLGAVPVLAHPFLNLQEDSLRTFLPQAVAAGLIGMETLYPKFSRQTMVLAKQIADEFGLLESGGSDFHGENKPDIQVGTGKQCNLSVPASFLEILREKTQKTMVESDSL